MRVTRRRANERLSLATRHVVQKGFGTISYSDDAVLRERRRNERHREVRLVRHNDRAALFYTFPLLDDGSGDTRLSIDDVLHHGTVRFSVCADYSRPGLQMDASRKRKGVGNDPRARVVRLDGNVACAPGWSGCWKVRHVPRSVNDVDLERIRLVRDHFAGIVATIPRHGDVTLGNLQRRKGSHGHAIA